MKEVRILLELCNKRTVAEANIYLKKKGIEKNAYDD